MAFRPTGQDDLAPAGASAKLTANLAALEVLAACRAEQRWATPEEQAVLARWAGWGAIPHIFDDDDGRHATERETLRELLVDERAWAAARRTVLNAHYTDASVVTAMWGLVGELGFTAGRVLEPGCGAGSFIGFAPEGARMVGVELDPTTAAIAAQLYQARATVHAGGFEDYRAADGSFDAAIGNVPFAKVRLHDPVHNRGKHSLHNHFLIKSLHLVRPGGMVAALTSRFTLDARNPAARREMAGLADLVAAVRFPAGAFAAAAGTEVVMDLLVLRRREPDAELAGPAWATTVDASVLGVEAGDGEPVPINEFFAAYPDMILGEPYAGRGVYRDGELMVRPTGNLDMQLAAASGAIVPDARARGAVFSDAPAVTATREPVRVVPATGFELAWAQEGSFVVAPGGRIGRFRSGEVEAYTPRFRKDAGELARLVELRDAARAVLAVQVGGGSDSELADAQRTLGERYDRYKRLYGPLNRFLTARTGRFDPETGAEVLRRVRARVGGFRDDPDWPLLTALEDFDDETQTADKAAIFTERVISPTPPRLGVDTPAEAVAVCLDETGNVTIERVGELLGVNPTDARTQLGTLVYDDPTTGALLPAAQYLSGNIRDKLTAAERAAAADPAKWQGNVDALAAVMPPQLEPGEIRARLGAPWIPASDIERFCGDVLAAGVDVEHLPEIGQWTAKLVDGSRRSVALSSEWGTERADAVALLNSALNQRLHTVWDTTEGGGRVRNDPETLAARAKQEALSDRFSAWVWERPRRAERLADRYNELFCSVRLPTYDGSYLTLPGLADTFTPRQHQRDAVARILQDGRAMLAHEVGAGKTATMVIAAMELRRLGSVNKPAVVVPNHMLDQFSREWLQLYPTARLLVADKDRLSKERRKEFVARCATGDWDGIVFTQSGFARLPVGSDLLGDYLGEQLASMRAALAASKDGKGLSVKRLEARIAQLEETFKRLLSETTKDDGVRFEECGVDFVFVDEAHAYKNKRVVTSIDGAANEGSQRAQDLDAKLWVLRRSHGERTRVFATATPVANSIAELWVMQSYLQPDVLEQLSLDVFDGWAANFGKTTTALELAPDGASYRMKTRFARFQNVPELLRLWREVADVRTAEDLDLPVPAIVGGKPETVAVPASPQLQAFVADLARRAEDVRQGRVPPEEDNMLKITGDGRRAALDPRLVGLPADPEGGKITATARDVAALHHATSGRTYLDPTGRPAQRPGALQLVFCDVSTPASEGFNAYDELRTQLVRRGVPDQAVRYMQDAKTDEAKARLFAACRDGTVAVLVGSTETMGVGTNVQTRAVAEHDLDAPWRPADIVQRAGRVRRQGNQNPEVHMRRYVTIGSFDTYMWQTLERKAAFIAQVTRGDLPDRDVDDIGDQALSYAEIKALSSGDPRIMEKAGIDADVARLGRLERSHDDDQRRLRRSHDANRHIADKHTHRATQLEALIPRITDTRGDRFEMTVDNTHHTKRTDAGTHLKNLLSEQLAATPPDTRGELQPIGRLASLDIAGQITTIITDEVRLVIPATDIEITYNHEDWQTTEPAQIVQRLERQIQRIPDTITDARHDAAAATAEADRASTRLGLPFEHADELARLRRRQAELDAELFQTADENDPAQHAEPASLAAVTNEVSRVRERLDAVSANRQPPERSI
ncbi:MAG TPA: SNF2-related protein [Ilumatobacter sp.]|nr:SNF2-related protein [Ilumatobacter sp.]